jgi:hypothetical protein
MVVAAAGGELEHSTSQVFVHKLAPPSRPRDFDTNTRALALGITGYRNRHMIRHRKPRVTLSHYLFLAISTLVPTYHTSTSLTQHVFTIP